MPIHTSNRPTRTRPIAAVAALALALGLGACGSADDDTQLTSTTSGSSADAISVSDAWVRATTGTDDPSMTAAFMVLDNDGEQDVALVAASSPEARSAELHEMASVDGEVVMQQVADGGITITAGRGKVLEPGGYHVMLMGVHGELAPGDEVELQLEFADGSTESVTAPVKEFVEEEGHYHSPGTEDDHSHDDSDDAGKRRDEDGHEPHDADDDGHGH